MDDNDRWSRLLADAVIERALQPQRICQLCVAMLGMTGAGIGVVTESGNRGSVCTTDAVSSRIEELQFTLGEGPCVDAVMSGMPVLISDLQDESEFDAERWPAFMEGARAAGVRGVFAFPLRIGAITVGALDLYCDQPGDLDSYQLRALLLAADAAALALLHLDTSADGFGEDLEAGTTYQLQVHQATGMVQVQLGVTTEEAFLMLRARAFSLGRPLASVATDVVKRRLRFTKEDS